MTLDGFVRVVIEATLISLTLAAAAILVGGSIFDFLQTRLQKQLRAKPFRRALRARPDVTVIVRVGHKNIDNLAPSLESILTGSYQKCHISIYDPLKRSEIQSIVDSLAKRFPSRRLSAAPNMAGLSIDKKSQLILELDRPLILDPQALKQAVTFLAQNPTVSSVYFSVAPAQQQTLPNLLDRLTNPIHHQVKKCLSLTGMQTKFPIALLHRKVAPNADSRYVASAKAISQQRIYWRQAAKYSLPKKPLLLKAVSLAVSNYLKLVLIALPFVIIYAYNQARIFHNLFPVTVILLGLAVFLSLCLLADERLVLSKKFVLFFSMPILILPLLFYSLITAARILAAVILHSLQILLGLFKRLYGAFRPHNNLVPVSSVRQDR